MSAPTTVEWLRTAVTRVGVGSGRLGVHLGRRTVARARTWYKGLRDWVRLASGFDKGFRLGLLVGALLIVRKIATGIGRWAYHRIESGAWGPLLFMAAGVWVVAAYRAGSPGWEPKQRPIDQDGDEDGVEQSETAVEQAPAPRPVSPVALVAAVRDIGTPHAQLKPLAKHLGTTTDEVRAAAQRVAWAVKDVRMQGRSTSAGLRWDEAPAPSEAYPSSGVVGAGQLADDNDDDAETDQAQKGLRVTPIGLSGSVVHDPAETVRRHKVRGQ